MKKTKFLLFFIYTINFFSQSNEKEALVWFDNIVGKKNLDINIGVRYVEKYRSLEGNYHFLFNNQFNKSTIKYDNQTYYEVPIKYDILDDDIIVNIPSERENYSLILNKSKIESFILFNKLFVNLKEYGINEKLYSNNKVTLFKKYSGHASTFIHKNNYFNKFSLNLKHLIFIKGKFYSANSKKELKKIFLNKKDLINTYFSNNKKKFRDSKDDFLIELLKKLN